jgi:hypothetical protein
MTDPDVLARYRKVRRLARAGVDGERDAAELKRARMAVEHPGIDAEADVADLRDATPKGPTVNGHGPQTPPWGDWLRRMAESVAHGPQPPANDAQGPHAPTNSDFSGLPPGLREAVDLGVDAIKRTVAASKRAAAVSGLVEDALSIRSERVRSGKLVLKIEIDADRAEELIDLLRSDDDIEAAARVVGDEVAAEFTALVSDLREEAAK